MNYERFPEGLNPYELSDLLAGIRQLTTDLAKEREKRELTFHEKQRLDLLLDNMNWKLPVTLQPAEEKKDEYRPHGQCKECSNNAVIDYNKCGHWVCKKCYDRLSDEFDEEYK